MRTMKLLIVSGIATTTLLASTAVTASAQSTTIKDKRADVVSYDSADDDDKGTVLDRADSTASGIDVTSMQVKHSKKSLKVTIKFAKLAKKTPIVSSEIKAKIGKKTVSFYAINMDSTKRISVFSESDMGEACNVKLFKKTGTKGSLSYTIPRSCLKKPKSVQLTAGVIDSMDNLLSEEGPFLTDAISKSSTRNPSWTKSLKPS